MVGWVSLDATLLCRVTCCWVVDRDWVGGSSWTLAAAVVHRLALPAMWCDVAHSLKVQLLSALQPETVCICRCREEWRHHAAGSVSAGRVHRYAVHAVTFRSLHVL